MKPWPEAMPFVALIISAFAMIAVMAWPSVDAACRSEGFRHIARKACHPFFDIFPEAEDVPPE